MLAGATCVLGWASQPDGRGRLASVRPCAAMLPPPRQSLPRLRRATGGCQVRLKRMHCMHCTPHDADA